MKNPELLKDYQSRPCEICGSNQNVSAHHIKTRGSGGDDHTDNIVALCQYRCHLQVHQYGLTKFCNKHPEMIHILKEKNWVFDEFLKKWV